MILVTALILAGAGLWMGGRAEGQGSLGLQAAESGLVDAVEKKPSAQPGADNVSVEAKDPAALREEYLKLVKERAELMPPEDLQVEVEATKHQIEELKAAQKLQAAVQLLEALTKEHPQCKAAVRAKRMLRSSAERDDGFTDRFEDQFGTPHPDSISHQNPFSPPKELRPVPARKK
jgi:hypothetical protein